MIDPKLLTDQADLVDANNKKRGKQIDITIATGLVEARARLIKDLETKRAAANDIAARIPAADGAERGTLVDQGREVKEQTKELEAELKEVVDKLDRELFLYPNILRADVPEGKDESQNEMLKTVGEKPSFDFTPKDHVELATTLGILDMERAAKVAGSRFTYLKGDLVLLELALLQYALETVTPEGFVPVIPPHIVPTQVMGAMGYLAHGGEEEIYHLRNDDAVLIGTSEQSIGPLHMNETIDAKELPLRYVGFSPCYRREAGSYGKDMGGMLRVHQFDKVELFSFTYPDHSDEEHEFILSLEEKIMTGLGLPYQVLKLCSGDTGTSSARTYDIETWLPGQGRYRETSSTSNTTDYQTRALNIRYKGEGKGSFVHALNGTAIAMSRTPIAIMENYQQADGSIVVPEVLRKWMGKAVINNATSADN